MLVNMDISMMNDMHQYIRAKMGSTSKRMIQMKLSEKGISKELFDRIYQEEHEELEEDPEIKAIKTD